METHLFNLKFTAKQLQKQSKKSIKDEEVEKAKLKKVDVEFLLVRLFNKETLKVHEFMHRTQLEKRM